MTLAVAFKGPEGIVLAVDSRVTLTVRTPTGQQSISYFDNATKLFGFGGQPYIGAVTHGMGAIGQNQPRTINGFIPEFEERINSKYEGRVKVGDVASELGKFFAEQWSAAGMPSDIEPTSFLVAGFDLGEAYGRIYGVSVPAAPDPVEYWADGFGYRWGGQGELVDRIFNGFDQRASAIARKELSLTDEQVRGLEQKWSEELEARIPWRLLPLQDCVDLSAFMVTMTSAVQAWSVSGVRGVGGPVDIATITRKEGFRTIKRKEIAVRE